MGFGGHFPIFRLIFSYFLGEAEISVFPIFSYFGEPEIPNLAGGQGRKASNLGLPKKSCEKKAPRATRAMRRNVRDPTISTVFWIHRHAKPALPNNKTYENTTGCNRPLQPYWGPWKSPKCGIVSMSLSLWHYFAKSTKHVTGNIALKFAELPLFLVAIFLTIGSFLLKTELLCLHLFWAAFC